MDKSTLRQRARDLGKNSPDANGIYGFIFAQNGLDLTSRGKYRGTYMISTQFLHHNSISSFISDDPLNISTRAHTMLRSAPSPA